MSEATGCFILVVGIFMGMIFGILPASDKIGPAANYFSLAIYVFIVAAVSFIPRIVRYYSRQPASLIELNPVKNIRPKYKMRCTHNLCGKFLLQELSTAYNAERYLSDL
jgi:hypothetical protein